MSKIDKINEIANNYIINTDEEQGYSFTVGSEIGLKDFVSDEKEDVLWYNIALIECDPNVGLGLPIAFLYLTRDNEKENIHQKVLNDGSVLNYAEIIDSISDRIVIPG